MINIAKLLEDAQKGMKLYSPLFGNVEFEEIMDTDYVPIRVMKRGYGLRFDKYGRYMGNEYPDSECLLFPSKDCRTWEGWKAPVEPKFKFKVGDWIVRNEGIFKITQYEEEYGYNLTDTTGRVAHFVSPDYVKSNFHLWTVQDAKSGDVLACSDWLFILKQFNVKGNKHKTYCHYDLTLKRFKDDNDSYMVTGSDEFHPATKEQRELLFQKMKEAGYEWDADKKELKKIQPHYDIRNFKPFDHCRFKPTETHDWIYADFWYIQAHYKVEHLSAIEKWES